MLWYFGISHQGKRMNYCSTFHIGNRLHDVQINIRNNGTEASCGFYKGPADTGDRISVYCVSGTVGRYVQLTILSHVGNFDIFNVCEVQVFVDVEIQD